MLGKNWWTTLTLGLVRIFQPNDRWLTPTSTGPTCKKLVDPSQAYKSAAFVVSEEELIFSRGGCKNATANSKRQDTLILDSDDDELPDAVGIIAGISAPQKKNPPSQVDLIKRRLFVSQIHDRRIMTMIESLTAYREHLP